MVELEKKRVRKHRIRSMRKPRRVLLALGACGCCSGLFLVMKALFGGQEQFLLVGIVYILFSLFLVGMGEAVVGISNVRRNTARRKSIQR